MYCTLRCSGYHKDETRTSTHSVIATQVWKAGTTCHQIRSRLRKVGFSGSSVWKTGLSFTRWNQRTQPFSWLRQRRSPRLMSRFTTTTFHCKKLYGGVWIHSTLGNGTDWLLEMTLQSERWSTSHCILMKDKDKYNNSYCGSSDSIHHVFIQWTNSLHNITIYVQWQTLTELTSFSAYEDLNSYKLNTDSMLTTCIPYARLPSRPYWPLTEYTTLLHQSTEDQQFDLATSTQQRFHKLINLITGMGSIWETPHY